MFIANLIAYILVIVGALNWGLVGMFQFDLVAWLCGSATNPFAIVIYIVIALAAVWLIIAPFLARGKLALTKSNQ